MNTKICFLVPSFSKGGSEKNIAFILNNMPRHNFSIDCIVIYDNKFEYDIHPNINFHFLKAKSLRGAFLQIFKIIKKNNFDIVFSNMPYLNIANSLISILIRGKYKVICRESILISKYLENEVRFSFLWKLLLNITYKRANYIVAQCEEMKQDILDLFLINQKKVKVIGNPILLLNSEKRLYEISNQIKLLSIGRLTHQKGFDILIESISFLDDVDVKLTIVGDGDLYSYLNLLIQKLNLSNKVSIINSVTDINQYYNNHDIFCTTSRYEGFPNVVLESLASSLIVCSTPSVTGINEIKEYNNNSVFISKTSGSKSFSDLLRQIISCKPKITEVNLTKWHPDIISSSYNTLFSK